MSEQQLERGEAVGGSERDFELMLYRLVRVIQTYQPSSSPPPARVQEICERARDLLLRKGSASPLKSDPFPFRGVTHPALKTTWWVNLYPDGLITSDLCWTKEEALNRCTYTGEIPNAAQIEVRIIPVPGQGV